jgi:hypothetical protein
MVDYLDPLEVIPGCDKGGGVPAQVLVVVLDVEAEAEEDVVPDEHLHLRLLTGVDRHHVPCIQSHNIVRSVGNIIMARFIYEEIIE